MSEIRNMQALLEHVDGQYKAIQEGVDFLVEKVAGHDNKLDSIDDRLKRVEVDLSIVKDAVKSHSRDIDDLKTLHPNMRHA